MKRAYIQKSLGVDKLATIMQANTIIQEYSSAGFVLSLRQLYYQFVARGLIENSDRSYKNLGATISDGRKIGKIDWEAIEDRGRNLQPWLIQESARDVLDGIERRLGMDFWRPQGVYVEVWVEKDALSSVVERPCEEYRVPYLACKGYLSDSEAWRAGRRFKRMADRGRQCHLIHLGDHDPSGIDMPRDNDDRLQMFSDQSEIQFHRIALNMDQVEEYSPPPNPAKTTDSRHKDYIEKYGTTSWELDALEPRVLFNLIRDKLTEFIDPDVWTATGREEQNRRQILSEMYDRYDDVVRFLDDTRDAD